MMLDQSYEIDQKNGGNFMLEMLETYYGINGISHSPIQNIPSYIANNIHYLIISLNNSEEFNVEQAVLAYYLREQNTTHIGYPLQNIDEQFITKKGEKEYVVVRIDELQEEKKKTKGEMLASFHLQHQSYPYEPRSISSYGMWKKLWVEKLSAYEHSLEDTYKRKRTYFERAWMDIFPYIIGITENAIQYIGNVEKESIGDEHDQSTITFERYTNQLDESAFLYDELHVDHPMRDVAEWVRSQLLQEYTDYDQILSFLQDYHRVYPLSSFRWKIIYARLLYPAHLFDAMDMQRNLDERTVRERVVEMCVAQERYEKRMNRLFHHIERNHLTNPIPMIQWR